jgi:hypothetical protein
MATVTEVVLSIIGILLLTVPAFANEGGNPADYSGISYMYYSLLALVLGYGIYDTFFKKS